jgi:hypothetical protein
LLPYQMRATATPYLSVGLDWTLIRAAPLFCGTTTMLDGLTKLIDGSGCVPSSGIGISWNGACNRAPCTTPSHSTRIAA